MRVPKIMFGQDFFEQQLAELQAMNQRHIEPLEIKHQKYGTVKVFNVGEKSRVVPLGGLGSFYIPECPKGAVYSEPVRNLWKVFPEGRATEHLNKMRLATLDGYLIAESLVGYGIGFPPEYGLRKEGVFTCNGFATMKWEDGQEVILRSQVNTFEDKQPGAEEVNTREVTGVAIKAARKSITKSWPAEFVALKTDEQIGAFILSGDLPTEQEIDEANSRLTAHAQELVTLANSFWAAGNQLEATQPPYLWAAKRTGNSGLPWAKGVVMMSTCTWCRSPIDPDAIICLACKQVAPGKEQQVIDAKLVGYEHLWAGAAKTGKRQQPGA